MKTKKKSPDKYWVDFTVHGFACVSASAALTRMQADILAQALRNGGMATGVCVVSQREAKS
jgi:hypothetical protein